MLLHFELSGIILLLLCVCVYVYVYVYLCVCVCVCVHARTLDILHACFLLIGVATDTIG